MALIISTFTIEWVDVKMSGVGSTAELLMNKLVDLDGGLFRSMDEGQLDEDYTTKWKKFLNEENMDNKVVGDTSTAVRDAEEALEGESNTRHFNINPF